MEEIRYGNRVFSGSSAPALHEHPINKDLIAHFKSKGDSVSWGIAESIEKYEEDTEKKVSWGTDIASLYDQETECELAREVENRIEEVLSDDAAIMDDAQVKKRAKLASRFGDENADIGFAPIPSGFVSYVYEVVDALKFHPWSRGCGFETSKTDARTTRSTRSLPIKCFGRMRASSDTRACAWTCSSVGRRCERC